VSDSENFQIDFASALWGDGSPAASRKARGGEVWIVERPALPLGLPLSLDTHQPMVFRNSNLPFCVVPPHLQRSISKEEGLVSPHTRLAPYHLLESPTQASARHETRSQGQTGRLFALAIETR
jgi:hypothetical protein